MPEFTRSFSKVRDSEAVLHLAKGFLGYSHLIYNKMADTGTVPFIVTYMPVSVKRKSDQILLQ